MPNGAAGGSVMTRACAALRLEGEGLHEAVARLDHVGRAFDALLRQQRGLQALARGVAGVQALDVGAAIDEGEQPGRARGGDARARSRVASAESPRSLPAATTAPNTPTAAVGWKPRWRRSGWQARPIAITAS